MTDVSSGEVSEPLAQKEAATTPERSENVSTSQQRAAASAPVVKRREVKEEQRSRNTTKPQPSSAGGGTSQRAGSVIAGPNQNAGAFSHPIYGQRIQVKDAKGQFPNIGSTLGPYFCLGQLGKGTFSSVHKCVNLDFHVESKKADSSRRRLAAAKVELRTFQQSGVLESEATILDFLHRSLPPDTVPVYMGHYKSSQYAAILMEYLEGEDMNQLRDAIIRQGTTTPSRRLHVEDAVYLTADVFLPLLKRMHAVGVVHRDVKPSNAVRMHSSATSEGEDVRSKFCLVDFGLSKSIVVPEGQMADEDHPWKGDIWLKPANYKGKAFYRKERGKADFRGSSMYASLRVHQHKDYCPRDDVWSVLYVFCDLVSGGLPWMSHAANKERNECGHLKEIVQGERKPEGAAEEVELKDDFAQLLMGDEYHVSKHRREQKIKAAAKANQEIPPNKLTPLPLPLKIASDEYKVECLRKAFKHLATLQFWDFPDYDFVAECIRGFLKNTSNCPEVTKIQWDKLAKSSSSFSASGAKRKMPMWHVVTDVGDDPAVLVNSDMFDDELQQKATEEQSALDERKRREEQMQNSQDNMASLAPPPPPPSSSQNEEKKEVADERRSKLPVSMQFALEQMVSHARHKEQDIPKHIVLRDWFQVCLPLLHTDWDSKAYEESHRSKGDDGFKRDHYLKLLLQCQDWANLFGNFRGREYFFHSCDKEDQSQAEPASKQQRIEGHRRSIQTCYPDKNGDMILLSKALFGLKLAIKEERKRRIAPPSRISFA
mmetsp:Transcript_14231/g.39478  ORF Transcript_14231/g.39478 Transcript_14231/m.39478 type:complete len:769 (-) Transcript_14231:64-2370(-)